MALNIGGFQSEIASKVFIYEERKMRRERRIRALIIAIDEVNNTHYVETESELFDAMGSHERIVLDRDITITSDHNVDIGSADIHLDLNGYSIDKDSNHSGRMFRLTTTGAATVENGKIVSNGGAASIGYRGEVYFTDASVLRVRDIDVVDQEE